MKRVLITVLVLSLITSVAAVFAEGQVENGQTPYGAGRSVNPRWDNEYGDSLETISVTGKIYFEDRVFPELISDSKKFELMVPRYYQYGTDLKEGQTITVEGFLAPETGPCCTEEEAEGEEVHLRVTKAIIDGIEYDFWQFQWGMMDSSDSQFGRNSSGRAGRTPGRGAKMRR